jgi:streptogramin lyase
VRRLILVVSLFVHALVLAVATAGAGSPKHITIHLQTGSFPNDVSYAFGRIWVVSHRGYGITRIDPATNRGQNLNVPTNQCYPLATGAGRLWFSNCSGESPNPRVYALDPRTGNIVARASGEGVAFGDGSIWTIRLVTRRGGQVDNVLVRLDPRTRIVLARISLPISPDVNGQSPGTFGVGALWLSNSNDVVARVDPATNTVAAVIPLPGGKATTDGYFSTGRIAFAAGKVWVPAPDGLYQIDPATNTATRLPIALHGFSQLGDVNAIASGNHVFVRTSDTSVAEIDASTGAVVHRYTASGGGGGFTVARGSLWIANAGNDTVWREPLH